MLRGSDKYRFSKEGVTQGDPLSMLIYAVALLPLVKSPKAQENRLQTAGMQMTQLALVTSRRFTHGMISWLSKDQLMNTFLSPRNAV